MTFRRSIFFLVAASVIAKLLFLFISRSHSVLQPFEYENMALNLLNGIGLQYTHFNAVYHAYLPPGFPVLCFLVYKFFGHHTILIVFLQIMATSLTIVPVSLIARRIFDEKSAILAGLLVAFYPPYIIYSVTKLHTLSFDSLLFILSILFFLRLKEHSSLANIILAGVITGLATLFRSTGAVFLALALIWFCVFSKAAKMIKFKVIAGVLIVSALVVLPWNIRNYIVFRNPFMMTTNSAECLWYGNMPGSSGSLYAERGVTLIEKAESQLPREFYDMNEVGQAAYLRKLTAGYFKADPAGFIGRIFKKAYYFWYFSPNQGSLYPILWMTLYKFYYILIFILALFSVWYNYFYLKKVIRADVLLVGLLFLAITSVHALYYVEARHRWAIEALLLIFSANGLIAIADLCRRARLR